MKDVMLWTGAGQIGMAVTSETMDCTNTGNEDKREADGKYECGISVTAISRFLSITNSAGENL